MRKTFFLTLWALLAIVAMVPFVACSDNDDPGVKSYEVTVNLTLPEGVDAASVQDLKLVTTKGTVSDTISLNATTA